MIDLQAVGATVDGHEILRDVTLSVGPEEVVALVGPSGAGKSTLLRVVLGFVAPSHGAVRIGPTLVSAEGRILVPPEERRLAMVFQDLALWPHMTVREHLEFAANGRDPRRIDALLRRVGLDGKKDRRPSHLSGGERQRVALARALIGDPVALLLDEPLASVDVALRIELTTLLRELLRERKRPVLLVTHDLREAAPLADRLAVLEAGTVVQAGTIAQLQAQPATEFVKALLADRS